MAISKFEESVDIIAALPTAPSSPDYTAEKLKATFDLGANKIKNYINETLVPGIEKELADSALGGGVYRYLPARRLLRSYTQPGSYTVNAEEWGSFNDLYEIVLVGGGGGGTVPSGSSYVGATGGGGGGVKRLDPMTIKGQVIVTVGAGGAVGQNGGNSTVIQGDSALFEMASGGQAALYGTKIGRAGGIGGTDSTYSETKEYGYGAGGDACGYGMGAKGGLLRDDIRAPQGYGAGGWGPVSGTSGAVFIYGYKQD